MQSFPSTCRPPSRNHLATYTMSPSRSAHRSRAALASGWPGLEGETFNSSPPARGALRLTPRSTSSSAARASSSFAHLAAPLRSEASANSSAVRGSPLPRADSRSMFASCRSRSATQSASPASHAKISGVSLRTPQCTPSAFARASSSSSAQRSCPSWHATARGDCMLRSSRLNATDAPSSRRTSCAFPLADACHSGERSSSSQALNSSRESSSSMSCSTAAVLSYSAAITISWAGSCRYRLASGSSQLAGSRAFSSSSLTSSHRSNISSPLRSSCRSSSRTTLLRRSDAGVPCAPPELRTASCACKCNSSSIHLAADAALSMTLCSSATVPAAWSVWDVAR
mmetsp:Transcript_20756/g.55847  ORF Transcript_20756/g.55847 Transcript_20756/m.55847 type:complete len:342 (+) Transcript_20756:135-1160(+)